MKKLIPIVLIIIVIIALGYFLNNNQTNDFIELSKKEYSENIKNPDRIIYKPSKEDKYYEILPEEELYSKIIEKLSENIGKLNENIDISQETIDEIHSNNSYIEFDYNEISKNYIIPFDVNNKGIIKLKTEGATLLNDKVKDVKKIKKLIDKDIKKNDRKSYTMNTNKEYISTKIFDTFPYSYQQQFKEIDYTIYQKVITNWEDYELYKAMCELKLSEQLPEDIFDNNVLVLTVAMTDNITVKSSIGNIKYTYDSSKNTTYGYRAHLYAVSKIVNTNCIYNTNLVKERQEQANKDFWNEYDEKIDNLDGDAFVTDFESYIKEAKNDALISEAKAKEIANIAFKEAARIVGEYDVSSQTMKKEAVYCNNFFTAKYGEGHKNYGNGKTQAYVFSREDEMGNGVKIYIDINTGKIIGGQAFGD